MFATGSEARSLPGVEFDGKVVLGNREILSLPMYPQLGDEAVARVIAIRTPTVHVLTELDDFIVRASPALRKGDTSLRGF